MKKSDLKKLIKEVINEINHYSELLPEKQDKELKSLGYEVKYDSSNEPYYYSKGGYADGRELRYYPKEYRFKYSVSYSIEYGDDDSESFETFDGAIKWLEPSL